ncbi:MAG: peptidase S9, partial [Longimicrobiales bacterium]
MPLLTTRGLGLLILALATSLVLPAPSAAQYFGRQKVNYENFDWQVLETPKFDVHFYPDEEELARDAARMAERWYTRLSAAFQHEFDKKPLILYADHPDFQQTNVIGGRIGEGTGGVTEGLRNRVIMPFTGVYADNDHVLGHELVHVFQYDLASSPTGGGLAGMARLPLYLIEGMAEYLSLGRQDPHTAMWLRDAALRGELPTLAELNNPRFFPYRYGQAMWAYIGGRYGDRAVTEIYRIATRQGFEAALLRVIGITSEKLSQEWITEIRSTYLPVVEGRQRARDAGTPVLFDDELGAMNLSPAASPDGNYVAYFGRRNVFTIDLLVADSRTGQIVKRLTSPNRNEHFDAISFINSAGTWSPDGRQFAFIVFKGGDNQISILDVGSGNTVNTFDFDEVGSIHHVAWSPDGRTIAFSGMAGGKSNLYLLDLPSGDIRQLMDDRYAALMPTWSPDGRMLAYVTDRAGTDFDRLIYGEMGLALYDLASGRIDELDIFDGAKHINPQFSPDGRDLYFVANREGFSDVYRLELEQGADGFRAGDVYQITRLATGVSGITALSPAMTVAANTGRLLFSVFENSGNNIYGLDAEQARGTLVQEREAGIGVAGLLPPIDAEGSGMIASYLADSEAGLPADGNFEVKDYNSAFGLEYLGPPSIGVGVSNFGTGVNGGVSAFFGDMLGNHMLGGVIMANGGLKDIGGLAQYINASRRINWGGTVGHIPYAQGYITPIANDPESGATEWGQVIERLFVDQAALSSWYPLSQTRRFELSAGVTRYSWDREIYSAVFDGFRRQVSPWERRGDLEDEGVPDPVTFVEPSIAYVGDNSYFAFTSPVAGERFRLQVSPTIGTLQFQTVLADYRRYFLVQPVTFAVRALHYGRYGADSHGLRDGDVSDCQQAGVSNLLCQSQVLSPLNLGWQGFVRGYSTGSISDNFVNECESASACSVYNRLRGSRVALASFEIRIPLIGTEQFGLLNFPFLPTEIAPFIDAGAAWSSSNDPRPELASPLELKFATDTNERVPVFSAGIAARFNILGYMVL